MEQNSKKQFSEKQLEKFGGEKKITPLNIFPRTSRNTLEEILEWVKKVWKSSGVETRK